MRLCTKCNRLLDDGDLRCPNCEEQGHGDGAKQFGETASASRKAGYAENTDITIGILDAESRRYAMPEVEHEAAEENSGRKSVFGDIGISVEDEKTESILEKNSTPSISATQAFTIEIPLGEVLEKLEQEKKTYKKERPEDLAPQSKLEKSEKSGKDAGEIDDTKNFPFESIRPGKKDALQNDESAGIIEQELAAREQSAPKTNTKSLNKLGVSLFAVLIIAVLVFSTLLVTKLFSKPETTDEDYFLTRLTGTWSGEPFRFVDDPDDKNTYMELLKINSDATFTIQYFIVNENIPKGYLDGEWEVLEELSGTVKILPDNATLALIYEQNGANLVFVRDIIELEDNRIVLREYSDNDEYFYDMAFKRER